MMDAISSQKVNHFATLDRMCGYHKIKMEKLKQLSFVVVDYCSTVECHFVLQMHQQHFKD